jgi:hypothetical protein
MPLAAPDDAGCETVGHMASGCHRAFERLSVDDPTAPPLFKEFATSALFRPVE